MVRIRSAMTGRIGTNSTNWMTNRTRTNWFRKCWMWMRRRTRTTRSRRMTSNARMTSASAIFWHSRSVWRRASTRGSAKTTPISSKCIVSFGGSRAMGIPSKSRKGPTVSPKIHIWPVWLAAARLGNLCRKIRYSAMVLKLHWEKKTGIYHVLWTWLLNNCKKRTNRWVTLNCTKTSSMPL